LEFASHIRTREIETEALTLLKCLNGLESKVWISPHANDNEPVHGMTGRIFSAGATKSPSKQYPKLCVSFLGRWVDI